MRDPENPYAAPLASDPAPEAPGLWRIDGSDLWVRNGAFFKDVDLTSGDVHPDQPVARRVTVIAASAIVFVNVLLFSLAILGSIAYEVKTGRDLPFFLIFVVMAVLLRFTKRWTPSIMIGFEESRRRARMRKWLFWSAFAMFLLGIACPFLALKLLHVGRRTSVTGFLWMTFVPVVIGLLLTLVAAWLKRPPRCLGRVGSWFRLGRIAPAALDHLRTLATQTPISQPTGNFTYTINLLKFSLLDWFRAVGWKPLPCLRVLLGKFSGSPGFVSRQVMRMSPAFVAEERIYEGFRSRIAIIRESLDSTEWQWLGWDQTRMPDALETFIESATFLSSDGTCSLYFLESTSGRQPTVAMTILQSWLTDGRVVRTSNERALPCMHPDVLWERIPGIPPEEVIRRHLQAISTFDCETLQDGRDLLSRLLAMQQENHRWFHAKGIFGPLEQEFDGNS